MMAEARRLIVNADDLGRTAGINRGIFEAHEKGIVTSATLMVGFPAAALAGRDLARLPELGVGLHVTLTGGGTPLSAAADVPSLVNDRGRLARKPEDLGDLTPREVEAEVRLQYQRFVELVGRAPTHLDSHHHSHRHPVIEETLIAIAREVGIPLRRSSPDMAERFATAGVRTTDVFIERFFGDEARLDVLLEIMGALEPGVSELMCHPAHIDPELRESSTYVDARENELRILTDPTVSDFLREHHIQLTHFGKL